MLVRSVLLLSAVTALGSCAVREASPPPDRVPPQLTSPPAELDAKGLNGVITEVLGTPLAERLSPECLAIMRGYQQNVGLCRAYLDYFLQELSLADIEFQKESPYFWEGLINNRFAVFAKENAEQAQAMVKEFVIPRHPILSQAEGPDLEAAFTKFIVDEHRLGDFCKSASEETFKRRMAQVLVIEDQPLYKNGEAFYDFLRLYQNGISHTHSKCKYHCQFLLNVRFKDIKSSFPPGAEDRVQGGVSMIAMSVYYGLQKRSPTEAQDVLRKVRPEIYDRLAGIREDYDFVIEAYEEVERQLQDGVQPREENIGAQEFRQIMNESVEEFDVSTRFPPTNRSILRALGEESEPFSSFFQFVFDQDISGRSIIMKDKAEFWSNLVNYSFHRFAQRYRDAAKEIVERAVIVGHPFSDELQRLFNIDVFAKKTGKWLHIFIDNIVQRVLGLKLREIHGSEANMQIQIDFRELVDKYRLAFSWQCPELKYTCEFLKSVPIEEIKCQLERAPHHVRSRRPQDFVEFASQVYLSMQDKSPQKAAEGRKALEGVFSDTSHQISSKKSKDVIKNYTNLKPKMFDEESFRSLVEAALLNEQVSKELHPIYLNVLQAFIQASPPYQQFFTYIRENPTSQLHGNVLDRANIRWAKVIDEYLYKFMQAKDQTYREKGIYIILDLAKSVYPFSMRAKYLLYIDGPGGIERVGLQKNIYYMVVPTFVNRWVEIRKLNEVDMNGAHEGLARLIEEYSESPSPRNGKFKYACAFLMRLSNTEIEELVASGAVNRTHESSVQSLSEQAYRQIEQRSYGRAKYLLRSVLPHAYDRLINNSYDKVMEAYSQDGMEPQYR